MQSLARSRDSLKTDAQGRFSFTGYEGTAYLVGAFTRECEESDCLHAHEADVPVLRSFAAADGRARRMHDLSPTLNDAVETYQTMLRVGRGCAKVVEVDKMIPPEFYKAIAEIVLFLFSRRTSAQSVAG